MLQNIISRTRGSSLIPFSRHLLKNNLSTSISGCHQLPLHKLHQKLGAKFAPFAGYQMPVKYRATTIIEEHQAVRQTAGLFDVSHMGEVLIEGPGASAFVQYLVANNTSKLVPGQAQYSPMLNKKGGVIDDLLIYKLSKTKFMLVINASNIKKDLHHIETLSQMSNLSFSECPPQITNISDQICLLALQGPKAFEILNLALLSTTIDFQNDELKYYQFVTSDNLQRIGHHNPATIISRTGYTGEEGVEIYSHPKHASLIWEQLLEVGQSLGLKPVGLGARDILRLEAGFCLYGQELNEEIYPQEAGIGWAVKMKAGDFHGRSALQKAKALGFTRKLVPFIMNQPKTTPREGYPVLPGNLDTQISNHDEIGYVTSGSQSPILDRGIGLALVTNDSIFTSPGALLGIKIRNKMYSATVNKVPILPANEK